MVAARVGHRKGTPSSKLIFQQDQLCSDLQFYAAKPPNGPPLQGGG